MVYSGDGSRVGIVFNSGAIAALTTEVQRQVFTYATPFSDSVSIRGLHFSHNGTHLQTLSSDGMLQSWNVKNRRRVHVLHHNRDIRLIRVDASRQRAIVLRADKKQLELWSLETGATRKFVEVEDTVTMVAISPKGDYVSAIFAER